MLTRPITAAAGHAHMPSDSAPLAADSMTDSTGPHLRLEVADDGSILASLGGSDPEPTTVEELREAAIALAEAGGSVGVAGASSGAGLDIAAQIVKAFDDAGVPTTVEPRA